MDAPIRFLVTDLGLNLPSGPVTTQAWVSPYGISRLVLPMGLPDSLKEAMGRPLHIGFGEFSADALFVHHYSETGLTYCARFLSLPKEQEVRLKERIEKEGIAPSWSRRFPRISTANLETGKTPHPKYALLSWGGKEHSSDILNFTYDGLRLLMENTQPLRVGNRMNMSIYTSEGSNISDIDAEIRNFCHLRPPGRGEITEVGLRITDTHSLRTESYRHLIRDCCVALQKS